MVYPIPHPFNFIAPELSGILRNVAAEAERQGDLLPGQLEIIYQQRWFALFVPQSLGGLGLSLPQALHLMEALAWIDGSLGWTVTLCSGAAWFAGFLEPSAAAGIFSNPKVCLAGSGQPSGVAEERENGYHISGHWKWATGTPHATVFTANCVIHKNGKPLLDSEGQPLVRAFWFHRGEVVIHHNWFNVGMIATASHSFEAQGLTVPSSRCFVIDPASSCLPDAIFQYPFLPFAETTLSVNTAGMASRFMDLCRPSVARDSATKKLEQERTLFYQTVGDSWSELLRANSILPSTIAAVGKASRQLANMSLRLVDELYPLCGLEAADTRTEINRVWRDLHTASQHSLLRVANW